MIKIWVSPWSEPRSCTKMAKSPPRGIEYGRAGVCKEIANKSIIKIANVAKNDMKQVDLGKCEVFQGSKNFEGSMLVKRCR